MSGVVETPAGGETAAPADAATTTVDTSSTSTEGTSTVDSPFLLSEEVMNSSDLDEVEVPAEPVTTAPEAPATTAEPKPAETKPAETAAGAKPPTPAKPAEVKPAEVKPATPAVKPPVEARAALPTDPGQLLGELAKNREAIISNLAETRFKLSKEESDLLDVDANAGIQRVAARVYYEAATTTLNQLERFVKTELPRMIEQHTQTTRVFSEAEDEFHKEWPNLDRVADAATVRQYAHIFRQANPSATRADAIKAVGAIVSTVLNKPKVAAPAAPAARQNGAKPFTPASGAARVVGQTPVAAAGSAFAGMGMDFDQ